MIRKLLYLNSVVDETSVDLAKHGVIACGPIMKDGGLPYAVVLRSVNCGMEPEEDATNPDKFVVHNMVFGEDGKISFDHGNHIDVRVNGGVKESLQLAMMRWQYRVFERLGIENPLLAKAVEVLRDGSLADTYDDEGDDLQIIELNRPVYHGLQGVVANLTGNVHGVDEG